ncbi:MAG: PHP-associated domain-containing protein [Huintestinicola sp.]
MYKYETHMHTSEGSACSSSTAAEMARKYKEEGYTGIIVTDHFFNGNTAVDRRLPWKEKVELYCKGYEHAAEEGAKIGLDVFFGFEYGNGGSDFLVYGLDKNWLLENDNILDMELTRFLEYARSCGGGIIQAHPFRDYEYIRGTMHCPHFVDGIEIINASHTIPEFNERARIYAGWYDLPVTAGSDAHNTTEKWYGGGVEVSERFTDVTDYIRAVKERKLVRLLERRQ